ncbi:peptide chain release factor isoform X1 [Wolffia australiana]
MLLTLGRRTIRCPSRSVPHDGRAATCTFEVRGLCVIIIIPGQDLFFFLLFNSFCPSLRVEERASRYHRSKNPLRGLSPAAMAEAMAFGAAVRWPERRRLRCSSVADQSTEDKRNNKAFKELGFFSFKKKIEDAVTRARLIASEALETEEARRVEQEAVLLRHNLWDDPAKSSESLRLLSRSTRVVKALKELQYKAEEAKLIAELAETDSINHRLFKQAYDASMDVNKFLDQYEMSKFLTGPYDREGAFVTVRAESNDVASQLWTEKLVRMYSRWAQRHGYEARVIESVSSHGTGLCSATIELESEYVYGYLLGERGSHLMVNGPVGGSTLQEGISAVVDVIPLFLESTPDLDVDEADLEISSAPEPAVTVRHLPTGTVVQCSGERSRFANEMKALNRLKAKLLLMSKGEEPQKSDAARRKYVIRPRRLVNDIRTGLQLSALNSVLDGNIEPLIRAHISQRRALLARDVSAAFNLPMPTA